MHVLIAEYFHRLAAIHGQIREIRLCVRDHDPTQQAIEGGESDRAGVAGLKFPIGDFFEPDRTLGLRSGLLLNGGGGR